MPAFSSPPQPTSPSVSYTHLAVDEESQGAIREAVAENAQAQEQPERDKTQETERTEPLTVEPVRETLNMTRFDNCTFAAGFKPRQIQQDESNVIITLTV